MLFTCLCVSQRTMLRLCLLFEALLCFHMLPGMGIPTVTAARILKGQRAGHTGEETSLVMDTFPYVALSKVGAR